MILKKKSLFKDPKLPIMKHQFGLLVVKKIFTKQMTWICLKSVVLLKASLTILNPRKKFRKERKIFLELMFSRVVLCPPPKKRR